MSLNTLNRLTESIGANNISYILYDDKDFSVTGYKVMQNHSFSGIIRCAKIMYNGKIKLVYLLDDKKPLSLVVSRLGINELCTVITNLLQRVIDIKANGFFLAENLNLDYDKIFVDTTDHSVHLLYYPLSTYDTGKLVSFESNVRMAFSELFSDFSIFGTPQFRQLVNDITKTALPLDVVVHNFRTNIKEQFLEDNQSIIADAIPVERKTANTIVYNKERTNIIHGPLTMRSVSSSLVLTINRPDYIIGKNPSVAQGVILDNPAISRVHCRVILRDGKYFIQDEGSSNGTFVNGNRVEKGERAELRNGDKVRLANSSFIISF